MSDRYGDQPLLRRMVHRVFMWAFHREMAHVIHVVTRLAHLEKRVTELEANAQCPMVSMGGMQCTRPRHSQALPHEHPSYGRWWTS